MRNIYNNKKEDKKVRCLVIDRQILAAAKAKPYFNINLIAVLKLLLRVYEAVYFIYST